MTIEQIVAMLFPALALIAVGVAYIVVYLAWLRKPDQRTKVAFTADVPGGTLVAETTRFQASYERLGQADRLIREVQNDLDQVRRR